MLGIGDNREQQNQDKIFGSVAISYNSGILFAQTDTRSSAYDQLQSKRQRKYTDQFRSKRLTKYIPLIEA
ncbi:MAG: hypothetical protein A3F10_00605 [Coxiella sp. RIFCSPHIGHO2_12_FULL_42_15]|nr:MAG: hypothetical protein A3F10_00605 [Coxiella sp. RIFCSPHIGHO2_12_FULL_42_15]